MQESALFSDVFVLAHPDDELFVAPLIEDALTATPARRVLVAYMTCGAPAVGPFAERRRREAESSLQAIGVPPEARLFLGHGRGFPDGALHRHLVEAFEVLVGAFPPAVAAHRIVTHAWEGGHPDHDSCSVLARALAQRLKPVGGVLQVPFYRAGRGFPYRVLAPLPSNGAVRPLRISSRMRRLMVTGMFHHPSQWRTWLGVAPFILFKVLFDPRLPVQSPAWEAMGPPHAGRTLSESRYGVPFEETSAAAATFLQQATGARAEWPAA